MSCRLARDQSNKPAPSGRTSRQSSAGVQAAATHAIVKTTVSARDVIAAHYPGHPVLPALTIGP